MACSCHERSRTSSRPPAYLGRGHTSAGTGDTRACTHRAHGHHVAQAADSDTLHPGRPHISTGQKSMHETKVESRDPPSSPRRRGPYPLPRSKPRRQRQQPEPNPDSPAGRKSCCTELPGPSPQAGFPACTRRLPQRSTAQPPPRLQLLPGSVSAKAWPATCCTHACSRAGPSHAAKPCTCSSFGYSAVKSPAAKYNPGEGPASCPGGALPGAPVTFLGNLGACAAGGARQDSCASQVSFTEAV